jgi:hypothetical protein
MLRSLHSKELVMRTALFMLLCAVASGCAMGSSYIHEQDTRGGVLTLQGSEEDALADARGKMAAHCGAGNYQIVRRETVVVGHEQYTDTNSGYVENGARQREETTDTETQEDTEYGHDETADTTVVNQPTDTGDETYVGTDTSGDGYESTTGSSSSTTIEDEREQREGQESSSTVSGTREVRERRLHYVCGHGA